MYEKYYGLNEKPFSLTPDTEFYFQSQPHQQALNVLLVAIESGDGFIKLTGEVGTGKTLLCRKLLNHLDASYDTIYIPNPYMSCDALLQAVAEEMGLQIKPSQNSVLAAINQKLIDNAASQRRTVILLDEAQSLPQDSLEAIRLLSNLETEKNKLVQIVLFGQPELDVTLQQKGIRQLQQRIVHACRLQSLSAVSVGEYVEHRLSAAGYFGPRLFSESAIHALVKKSHGVPRLVNLLCDKAMMLAHASGEFHVHRKHIQLAANDSHQVASDFLPRLALSIGGVFMLSLMQAGL